MDVDTVLDRNALVERWQELGADPGSPDYYELNEFGQLILSPRPTNDHQGALSAGTRQEIAMKSGAYLRAGAKEVIVVGLHGEVEFFGLEGKRSVSALGVVLQLPSELF